MARIDWVLIRDDFVRGTDDYGVLAKRYGISRQSIELRASPTKGENWQLLRQQHRESHTSQNQTKTPVHSVVATETETEVLPHSTTLSNKLTFADIDALVNGAIARLYSQLQVTEARSLEKTAEVFTQLIDLKLRLVPPSPRDWAILAIDWNLPPKELIDELRKAYSS